MFDRELVIRQIAIECINDPITIGPHVGPQRIGAIAGGVGVPGQVEPDARPALAISRIGKESIDHPFVTIGR